MTKQVAIILLDTRQTFYKMLFWINGICPYGETYKSAFSNHYGLESMKFQNDHDLTVFVASYTNTVFVTIREIFSFKVQIPH